MAGHRAPFKLVLVAAISVSLIAIMATTAHAGSAGAPAAQAADKAGDDYAATIKKARKARDGALKRCASKPTKAKRRACAKRARSTFAKAKAEAQRARDEAREQGQPEQPQTPGEARDEYKECLDSGRPRAECSREYRDDRRGGRPGRR